MKDRTPSWQSTIIALALIALVGGIFIVVYEKDGIDTALKAWSAIGTLVGVIAGIVSTYFFGTATTSALQRRADKTEERLEAEQARRLRAEEKAAAVLMHLDPETGKEIRASRPDLFGPA